MNFIEVEEKFYILATSSFADQRTMVLKQGDTFGIFDWYGDIHQVGSSTQGIFHNDTRYISQMEMSIDGHRPMLLSASPREDNQMLIVDLTNPDLLQPDGQLVLRGSIHILRSKFLWQSACHEKIKFINYGLEPATFKIEFRFESDFTDIFEVRGTPREKKGKRWPAQQKDDSIVFLYTGLDDVIRKTEIHYIPQPSSCNTNTATYQLTLLPKQELDIEINIGFSRQVNNGVDVMSFDQSRSAMNLAVEKIQQYCADIYTSNEQFNDWLNRSRSDLITMATQTPYGLYPYAGVPWFSTPFGRDGIITAYECLWVEPELAKGVLNYLAHTQATGFNDFQDAEPGKIFHETRGGEMASLGEVPFKMYYGTIDATPLFISLAGAYLMRTNDITTIGNIWPNIESALYWIDNYGDIDGDGFLEYKTKSSKGLTNQGWKDSQDSVFHQNGDLAEDPIALCEVQGYTYDAKIQAAYMARALGKFETAERLTHEAEELKTKFNEKFWCEEKQIYALALDGKKQPCEVISSNAGHCLFSGIATVERARIVARTLLNENSFSGWGIRTIATTEARYNPMSYHNGSIWPHDNALIAFGCSRYHLQGDVVKTLTGIFDTAIFTEGQRLPELFCGFDRRKGQAPTSYPVACSPQAWSVGSVFLMLQACLGMCIRAAQNKIVFCNPMLPSFLQEITVTNLRINDKQLVLQIRNGKEGIDAVLLTPGSGISIEIVHNKMEAVAV
jgi:glycogen debranching enzyme